MITCNNNYYNNSSTNNSPFNLATKTKLSEATTTIKNSEMDLAYTTKALSDKEKTKTTNDTSYQKNKQNMEKKEKEIQTINVIKLSF